MSPYYPYMLRPQHSFVRANSGQTSYTFVIPMTDCGTRTFDNDEDGSAGFQNMIMIQTEEVVQELWDAARQIICDWTTRMEKLVTFRPFTVDVLQAREVRYSGDDVMCWMDIQLGEGPFSTSLDGIVKIGDQLAVVIYVQDGGLEYDMLVKNCFAYDSQDVEDERTTQLRLTNERGCLLKPKLMSSFRRTRNTGSSGADIIAYASLFAFKFPDKMDVFLSCEVELCTGGCTSTCEEDPGLPSSLMSLMEPTTTKASRPPPPTTTNPCLTRPGSPQCCARNPSHTACVTTTTTTTADPCGDNLNLPQCCARDPTLPQCTTTTRRTTTSRLDPCAGRPGSFECCMRNPNHPQCIARIPSTTATSRPGPCDASPGSLLCCATSPDHPACAATTTRPTTTTTRPTTRLTTTTTRPTTTTTRPTTTPRADSCVSDPGSSACCASDPSHASCVEQAPCSSPRDPRPQCQSTTTPPSTITTPPSTTTTPPSTTIDPENRATSGNSRQRRPAYGTRLSPEVLARLAQTRRRRDVALPLPVRNTVAMMRGFRVVGANDLTFPTAPVPRLSASYVDSVCLPRASFTVGLLMLSMVAITAVLVATVTSLRLRALAPYKTAEATNFYYKQ
ncbi:uncharacterized protein [Panulirus ornatus]|uniref:uncharacterized protein n=1 Tax=Panulirus ornatus TaxID=150431 RepID=UPI003A88C4A4